MSSLIVITGTTKGLGKEIFDLLIDDEHNLISISISFPDYQLEAWKKKKNIQLKKCDLSDQKAVARILDSITIPKKCSKIIFINNAGIIEPIGKISEADSMSIGRSINVNFSSPVLIVRRLLQLTKEKIGFKIINISTGAALRPIQGWAMYCSTKAAFRMFLDSIALEKDLKIKVIQFDPGVMNTSMQEKIRSRNNRFSTQSMFRKLKAEGKLKEPSDVARKIVKELL